MPDFSRQSALPSQESRHGSNFLSPLLPRSSFQPRQSPTRPPFNANDHTLLHSTGTVTKRHAQATFAAPLSTIIFPSCIPRSAVRRRPRSSTKKFVPRYRSRCQKFHPQFPKLPDYRGPSFPTTDLQSLETPPPETKKIHTAALTRLTSTLPSVRSACQHPPSMHMTVGRNVATGSRTKIPSAERTKTPDHPPSDSRPGDARQ